jgi:hypothetical protein
MPFVEKYITRAMRKPPISVTAAFALCLFALAFAGCSTGRPRIDTSPRTSVSWKPELLYILNQPYRRLYVEVDAVQGCEPDDATLAKLKDFLAAHCAKPDGIEIVRRPVIPHNEARGLSAEALACKVMQGPGIHSGTNQAAFLEILFYDGKLTRESGRAPGMTEFEPYPSLIMMDTSAASYLRPFQWELLTHEAGHALGLVERTNNIIGPHCADPHCLMYPVLHVDWCLHKIFLGSGAFTIQQTNFCAKCLAELADSAAQPPQTNIYFDGPVFVRSEPAYHVLSLPNHVRVVVGKLTEADSASFIAATSARPFSSDEVFYTANIKEPVVLEMALRPARVRELVDAAASDPLPLVRMAAAGMCAQRGLFAEAVQVCARSIQMDPEAGWFYNELAWIEATAPDAAFRDGARAVTNATKACELTHWKNVSAVDTLAAACAESGDFPQAVKYEKMALRLGMPAAKQKEFHDRLSLYQESKPFRQQPSSLSL